MPHVAIEDLSRLPRLGLKGPGAAEFLRAHSVPVPEHANRWVAYRGGLASRLGTSEFFLESGADDSWTLALGTGETHAAPQVVYVLREDTSLLLEGEGVHDLLAQTCSFPFESLRDSPNEIVMTQMIGVSIIALCVSPSPAPAYRIWCDPSFGEYLLHTLQAIAAEPLP